MKSALKGCFSQSSNQEIVNAGSIDDVINCYFIAMQRITRHNLFVKQLINQEEDKEDSIVKRIGELASKANEAKREAEDEQMIKIIVEPVSVEKRLEKALSSEASVFRKIKTVVWDDSIISLASFQEIKEMVVRWKNLPKDNPISSERGKKIIKQIAKNFLKKISPEFRVNKTSDQNIVLPYFIFVINYLIKTVKTKDFTVFDNLLSIGQQGLTRPVDVSSVTMTHVKEWENWVDIAHLLCQGCQKKTSFKTLVGLLQTRYDFLTQQNNISCSVKDNETIQTILEEKKIMLDLLSPKN